MIRIAPKPARQLNKRADKKGNPADDRFMKFYEGLLGYTVISIKKIDPSPEVNSWDPDYPWNGEDGFIIYNNPKPEYSRKSFI
ncbi:MAG: hypothetical protein P8X70_02070, partial [Nanoarchaeota archaeon]